MKTVKAFLESKWSLTLSIALARCFYLIYYSVYFLLDDEIIENEYYCIIDYAIMAVCFGLLFLIYYLIGRFVYPKIKEKKKAIIIAVVFELVISALFYLLRVFPDKYRIVNDLLAFLFFFNNPVSYGAWNISFASDFAFASSIIFAPTSVLFVVLFSKIHEAIKTRKTEQKEP